MHWQRDSYTQNRLVVLVVLPHLHIRALSGLCCEDCRCLSTTAMAALHTIA